VLLSSLALCILKEFSEAGMICIEESRPDVGFTQEGKHCYLKLKS
jgi:hypothetical protein